MATPNRECTLNPIGFRVQGVGFSVRDQGSGYGVEGFPRVDVFSADIEGHRSGFRVQSSGFRVQGSGSELGGSR